jgi:hypothetical protein
MAALIALAAGGALAAAGGQLASGLSAGKAAKKQAEAQKRAANRYAKALRSEASKLSGGMSEARKRSLQTGAALDRAALGQQARDEAKRGGRSPSAALEGELQASLQASAAEQQKMIDQMSTQEAQAKAAQRQAMNQQALQTKMQAQAIDPKAVAAAARAPMYGQMGATIGQPAMQLGMAGLGQQAQTQGSARAYQSLTVPGSSGQGYTDEQIKFLMSLHARQTPGQGGSRG